MKLTRKRLKELLHYDEQTGIFTRAKALNGASRIGQIAGSKNRLGYVVINVQGKPHYAHRLAFLYMIGRFPKVTDHKDGNPSNNAWSNLREATQRQNCVNRLAQSRNRFGLKGVDQLAPAGKFRASMSVNGKTRYLGVYVTPEEAHLAYMKASKEMHGEFASRENL